MKKLQLLIFILLFSASTFGQITDWGFGFDTPDQLWRFSFDTTSNPNCSWQIGRPSKSIFSSAYTAPNAILTDTINPVPANDTSIFYMKHNRGVLQFHIFVLHFLYQMDGDSTDFGSIEISPDYGQTWINILTEDTTYRMTWLSPKPTLNGSTNGWMWFDLDMNVWASTDSGLGGTTFPTYITADTVLFRFTYITDTNSTPHDGWMIDNFFLEDWAEGISEDQNNNLISVFPNPCSGQLYIERNKFSDKSRVQIFNYTGQKLYDNTNFIGEAIDTRQLTNGIYFLKYSDTENFCIKKIVIEN